MINAIKSNYNFNINNLARNKSINSDTRNIKYIYNKTIYINKSQNLTKNKSSIFNKNISINYNRNKKNNQKNLYKSIKVKKISLNNNIKLSNNFNKNSFEFENKNKTETNFFNSSNKVNSYKNSKNFHFFQLNQNNNEKRLNKTNSFSFNTSKNILKNNIIYFNSSLNDCYKNHIFNLKTPMENINKNSLILPKSNSSNSVSFIRDILNRYRKNCKNKNILKNIKINNLENKKKEEDKDNKILKGFSFLTMNKSTLEILFKKTPIKIQKGHLTCIEDEKIKSNIYLNPFYNSYGHILDDLSEKLGFMKGSINIIYPKISHAKYQFKDFEKTEELKKIDKNKIQTKNKVNKSLERKDIKYENKIKFYNNIEPKIIIKKCFTKYPIYIKRKGDHSSSSKMYSFKRQQLFMEKE